MTRCSSRGCDSPAEAKIGWSTSLGWQQSGGLCGCCLAALWSKLSGYPDAVSTATITPVTIPAVA